MGLSIRFGRVLSQITMNMIILMYLDWWVAVVGDVLDHIVKQRNTEISTCKGYFNDFYDIIIYCAHTKFPQTFLRR